MPSMSTASSGAPVDLLKGCAGANASSDAPVDLEKGATNAKAAPTEERMDPRVAMCILVSLDVGTVLFVFYCIGIVTLLVRRYGWDSWLGVLLIWATLVWAIWMGPKMKYDRKSTRARDDDSSYRTNSI